MAGRAFRAFSRRRGRGNDVKWAIVGLVVLNVVFFGWQLGRDREPVAAVEVEAPKSTTAMVNRLLLVSELERGVLRQRLNTHSPQASSAVQPSVDSGAADDGATQAPAEQTLIVPPEPGVECYTIGPLQNEDDISALSAWFNAQGSQAKLRDDERREVVSTWVFMPPHDTREDADKTVRAMQAANIDDIYVIPRGDMANAISLGLYTQEESLHRRVSELENRGFSPSVLPRYKTVTASWFDVVTNSAQPMTVGVLDQVFPGLIVRQVSCSDGPIAGDPAITYNSPDLRRDDSYSDNASGVTLDIPVRSGSQ